MEETFPMQGGDGDYSYIKNSHYQKLASDAVKGMMQDAVMENLDVEKLLSISTTVTIADLGCSVGPNTFFTVESLIESVQSKLPSPPKDLEIRVFFNDHSANDFNTLFASLGLRGPKYHAAGVPGSFYGRLFPRRSVTIACSSHSLHWLSKPPELGLGFLVHDTGAPADVASAYSDQFGRDFGAFMAARAEEIVSGGLVILVIPGTPDHDGSGGGGAPLTELRFLFDSIGSSLLDLVHEGVVEKSAVDAFNFPIHFPKMGEVIDAIESNGQFNIRRIEFTSPTSRVEGPIDIAAVIIHLRSATEGILTACFGVEVVDKVFDKMFAKAPEISYFFESPHNKYTQLFVVLQRNS